MWSDNTLLQLPGLWPRMSKCNYRSRQSRKSPKRSKDQISVSRSKWCRMTLFGLTIVLSYQRDAGCFSWAASPQSWSQVCRVCFTVVGNSHWGRRKARNARGQSTASGWRQSEFWRGILFCRACRSCKRSPRDEYPWCLRRELRPQKHARSLEHSTAAFTFERKLLISFFSSTLNAEYKAAAFGVGCGDFATIQKYGHPILLLQYYRNWHIFANSHSASPNISVLLCYDRLEIGGESLPEYLLPDHTHHYRPNH